MAKIIQNNFVNGEISPSLYGRSDLQAYYHACATCENFVVSKEGSLKKRHGIASEATVSHPFDSSRIVPYIYDRDEAGVIVFWRSGSDIMAEIRAKADLSSPGAAVTVYSPEAGGTAATDDYVKSIRCSQIGDTVFANAKGLFNKKIVVTWSTKTLAVSNYSQVSRPPVVTSITAVSSGLDGTPTRTLTYAAYIVKDGVISESKETSVNVKNVWTAGGYVTVTVAHGLDLDSKKFDYILIGKKSGSFFGELARFYPEDVDGETVSFQDENHTPSDVIYSQTNVLGDNFSPPLVTNAFQQRLVFANAGNNVEGKRTLKLPAAASAYTTTDTLIRLVSVTYNNTEYVGECTVSGNTITFPASRRYTIKYVNSLTNSNLPMTLWFSEVGNLYNFYSNRPADDSDPFSPTLMSTGPAFIRWLIPYQKMMVAMTDAGIFSVAGSTTEGFSASTCQISKLSNIAVSQNVQPVETEAGIVFVGADNKTLYTLLYDLQNDSTRPINRMTFAKHVTRKASITSIALQQYPDQVVWCALSDGTLAAFTFERDEEVYAWSRHTSTNVSVLEVVGTGSVTDSSTDHTLGDVVFVISDTASSFKLGKFGTDWKDVNSTESNVVAKLVTLPAESTQETIAFNNKNAKDVLLRLFESGPVKVKPSTSGLSEQTIVTGATPFTGEKKVKPLGYISGLGQMEFTSDTNANAEILAIVTKMEVD